MQNTNDPLVVKNSIIIDAPTSRVWDALTNPEQTKKYMFGCETVSDWKQGSSLEWKGTHEGKDMIFVKGNIQEIQAKKRLAYTTIDPNSTIEDKPENYLVVTYELTPEDGKTILTVTQGDYSKVADGQKRYNDTVSEGGWQPILEKVKELVEDREKG